MDSIYRSKGSREGKQQHFMAPNSKKQQLPFHLQLLLVLLLLLFLLTDTLFNKRCPRGKPCLLFTPSPSHSPCLSFYYISFTRFHGSVVIIVVSVVLQWIMISSIGPRPFLFLIVHPLPSSFPCIDLFFNIPNPAAFMCVCMCVCVCGCGCVWVGGVRCNCIVFNRCTLFIQ